MKIGFAGLARIVAGLALITALSGCMGETVEVPTAHRGKITTKAGLKDGILTPSKVRLSSMCFTCDDLIIAEVSDYHKVEAMKLYMPKDKLNLTFEVRGTFATDDATSSLDMIFARIPPTKVGNRVSRIDSNTVYERYAQQIIRDKVRSVMADYTIAEVMANREAISQKLFDTIAEALSGRPVKVLNFGLADMQPPEIIVTAEEKRKQREVEIGEALAQKEVRLTQAQANLEVAALEQAVELKQAETQVLVEQKLKEGFSQAYVAQRSLRILEALAASNNKVVLMPTEALNNPAMMIGLMNEALKDGEPKSVATAPAVDAAPATPASGK